MKKFLLIDGNAIFHRAYHSLPPFKTSRGEPTNAIYGFLRMLFDVYNKEKPEYLVIAWDSAAPTFRHEQFQEYKGTRPAPPEDLYPQLPRLKEVLKTLGFAFLELPGYEADDILGTLVYQAEKESDIYNVVVTGDRDTFQLVSDKTIVMMPLKGISQVILCDSSYIEQKMGIRPDQIVDYKALAGDSSDNIPGVTGIGSKQAVALLQHYGTLFDIYENLAHLPAGQKEKLVKNREKAFLSQRLAKILLEVPLQFHVEDFHVQPFNYQNIQQLFQELEFTSLFKKIEGFQHDLQGEQFQQPSLF